MKAHKTKVMMCEFPEAAGLQTVGLAGAGRLVSKRNGTRDAIIALLTAEGPMDRAEIAATLGRTNLAISGCINLARKTAGLIRISGWNRRLGTGGRMAPIYAAGEGEDEPCLKCLSSKAIKARHRVKWGKVLYLRARAKRGKAVPAWMASIANLEAA